MRAQSINFLKEKGEHREASLSTKGLSLTNTVQVSHMVEVKWLHLQKLAEI